MCCIPLSARVPSLFYRSRFLRLSLAPSIAVSLSVFVSRFLSLSLCLFLFVLSF